MVTLLHMPEFTPEQLTAERVLVACEPYEPLLMAYISPFLRMESRFAFILASAPPARALPRLTSTIAERIPMIAMTTRSSMSVKPRGATYGCI
jgi:hypothetical protein